MITKTIAGGLLCLIWLSGNMNCQAQNWQMVELPVKLNVGYAVRALDMNSDKKLDIAIVDAKRVLWLENPHWQEHVIYATPDAKADNVCFAPHDVDGDGLLDLALGADWQPNNTQSGGSIGWLHQQPAGTWTYHALTNEPTTHRMHWVELTSGTKSLVVAPLKGINSRAPGFEQTPVRLLALTPPKSAAPNFDASAAWSQSVLHEQLHVMHNFHPTRFANSTGVSLLCASYEGATWLEFGNSGQLTKTVRLGEGQRQAPPASGASEIRIGNYSDGRQYIATIEPWHGDKVVVYVAPKDWQAGTTTSSTPAWPRQVVDDQLAWGHAVACANIDADPEEELIIGVRDNQSDTVRCGVRIYDPDTKTGQWNRTLVDAGGVAVEDLITADFDGDNKPDIVAVGRATHNARIYWNR